MDKNHKALVQFVLEKVEREPIARRAQIYRGLAFIIGDPKEESSLLDIASDLEQAAAALSRLQLQFC